MYYSKVEICGVNTSKLKTLSGEEKRNLLARVKNGDEKARDELVFGNLRLVLSIIQRFAGRRENMDDLFQVGCIGLIKAIDNFDLDKEVELSTYAVPMIIGEIRRYLRDNIHGFEADIKTVEANPQISEGFCGMDIRGKHYAEKAEAGEWILAACKEVKGSDPVPLGSYRGFQMELSFDSFRHECSLIFRQNWLKEKQADMNDGRRSSTEKKQLRRYAY